MKIEVKREVEVKYIYVSVAVRYDEDDMANDAPFRKGDTWTVVIDLDTGTILDWPAGKTLSFNMKVTDEGQYILKDKDMETVKIINGYVPNKLLPGEYGDYLDLDIDETGKIKNWLSSPSLEEFVEYAE